MNTFKNLIDSIFSYRNWLETELETAAGGYGDGLTKARDKLITMVDTKEGIRD
jgi:hypothetical protein